MTKSSVMKSSLVFALAAVFAAPVFAASEPAIVAAPPGVAIDFYQVKETRSKGARFINTKTLPKVGYVAGAPAMQIERLRGVKKIHTSVERTITSADGKERTISNPVPAIEMTLSNADATAFADLMKKSLGQRILMEAEGTPIYAPLVRDARRTTTLTFTLADDKQREEVYGKLARFVKK